MSTDQLFRWRIRAVLALLTIALGARVVVGTLVPSGVFVAERQMGGRSPWVGELWPPRFVYPPERSAQGGWQQRVVVSPVTIRVKLPRASFQSVDVALDATGIPSGTTVGVERHLHHQDYKSVLLVDGRTTLFLQDVNQALRDLQFQFVFPGVLRDRPVVVRALSFQFHR